MHTMRPARRTHDHRFYLAASICWQLGLLASVVPAIGYAQVRADPQRNPASDTADGVNRGVPGPRAWAVIIQGLPGDAQHQQHFDQCTEAWTQWLTQRGPTGQGIPRQQVLILKGTGDDPHQTDAAATRESIAETIARLSDRLTEQDAFWLFFLGHANHDGQQAFFHIPGPDLRAVDYARLLERIPCQQQVLWLTSSSSGWFLEPLSRPGRVVITATQADAEPNDTEFPAALTDTMQADPAQLDTDQDGAVTLGEFLSHVVERVAARYQADDRAQTEHALLDDNGDGRGTQWAAIGHGGASTADSVAVDQQAAADQRAADQELTPHQHAQADHAQADHAQADQRPSAGEQVAAEQKPAAEQAARRPADGHLAAQMLLARPQQAPDDQEGVTPSESASPNPQFPSLRTEN